MRLHTNTLTAADAYRAVYGTPLSDPTTACCGRDAADCDCPTPLESHAPLPGVSVDVMAHGSRSHVRSLEVKLTGTSSRRPNPGTGPRDDDAYAATWDEWGMFLARLYAADPGMVAGTVKSPTYANAAHFHWATDDRYRTLTPADQHGKGGHRWEYGGAAGRAAASYSFSSCKCGAVRRYAGPDTVRAMFGNVTGAHR